MVAAGALDRHPRAVGVLDVGPEVPPYLAVRRARAGPCRVLDVAGLRVVVVVVLAVLVAASRYAAGDGVEVGELALGGVVAAAGTANSTSVDLK